MVSNFEKIIEFHTCSGLAHNSVPQRNVVRKNPELVKLRLSLIDEENTELNEAVENVDFVEVIDALADLKYVTYGTCSSFGINAKNVYTTVRTEKLVINPDILTTDPNTVSLCLSNIQTAINKLHRAVESDDFDKIEVALFSILEEAYRTSISFGIDPDRAFELVHDSNMTKFCNYERQAKQTVEKYKSDPEKRYDSPTYRHSEDRTYFVVYNESTKKILKSIDYQPVSFDSMLAEYKRKKQNEQKQNEQKKEPTEKPMERTFSQQDLVDRSSI